MITADIVFYGTAAAAFGLGRVSLWPKVWSFKGQLRDAMRSIETLGRMGIEITAERDCARRRRDAALAEIEHMELAEAERVERQHQHLSTIGANGRQTQRIKKVSERERIQAMTERLRAENAARDIDAITGCADDQTFKDVPVEAIRAVIDMASNDVELRKAA